MVIALTIVSSVFLFSCLRVFVAVFGRDSRRRYTSSRTGRMLWKTSLGDASANGPMTDTVNGRQYVAVAAGNALFAFGLR